MKRWYRTKDLVIVSVLFGIFVPVFGIGGILETQGSGLSRVLGIGTELAIGCILLFRFARLGVRPEEEGIIIRNPFRTSRLPWDRIRRFELRSAGLLGETGYVQLQDGKGVRIWGIFPPNRAFRPSNRDAEGLIEELNRHLRESRARRD
jgi:hypothetical protein